MKARVNSAVLLRTLLLLINVGVKVETGYHWTDRHGAPPNAIKLTAQTNYVIGQHTFGEIIDNGYRFVNVKASEKGLEINFERKQI